MEDQHPFIEENERFDIIITFGAGWYLNNVNQRFTVEDYNEQCFALSGDIDASVPGKNRIRCIDKRHARRVNMPTACEPSSKWLTRGEALEEAGKMLFALPDVPFPEALFAGHLPAPEEDPFTGSPMPRRIPVVFEGRPADASGHLNEWGDLDALHMVDAFMDERMSRAPIQTVVSIQGQEINVASGAKVWSMWDNIDEAEVLAALRGWIQENASEHVNADGIYDFTAVLRIWGREESAKLEWRVDAVRFAYLMPKEQWEAEMEGPSDEASGHAGDALRYAMNAMFANRKDLPSGMIPFSLEGDLDAFEQKFGSPLSLLSMKSEFERRNLLSSIWHFGNHLWQEGRDYAEADWKAGFRTFEKIGEWSAKKFPNASSTIHLLKLKREVDEAINAPGDVMEWADIFIAFVAAWFKSGHGYETIQKAAMEKLASLEGAEWIEEADGTFQSLKAGLPPLTAGEAVQGFARYIYGKPYLWRDPLTLSQLLIMTEDFTTNQRIQAPTEGWSDKLKPFRYSDPSGALTRGPITPPVPLWRKILCGMGLHTWTTDEHESRCEFCGKADPATWAEDPND